MFWREAIGIENASMALHVLASVYVQEVGNKMLA